MAEARRRGNEENCSKKGLSQDEDFWDAAFIGSYENPGGTAKIAVPPGLIVGLFFMKYSENGK